MVIKRIAYLGLGAMGSGMVPQLARAGYDVTVWNRTPERATPLRDHGVEVADTVAEAVGGVDLVMMCLSDDDAVEQVVWDEGGVWASVEAGQAVVDMSTVYPDLSRRQYEAFADRGVGFLDAPVFGSVDEAERAGLWIVVGGELEVFTRIRPVLEALSATVHHMGGVGTGTSMKLVGNLLVALQLEALGEALVLATKTELDLHEVLAVMGVADFRSPILTQTGAALVERDFETRFALKHLLKDANLIARLARDVNSPVAAMMAARETIKGAVNRGWGEENASALVKMLELQGDVEVKVP
jgi:3-hydroxyisobutyrate dehydrogenase-like beta-hydroxyacid dehydrogenase